MKLTGFLLLITLNLSGVALADEHPACSDVDFAYRDISAAELRTIAASCTDNSVSELYYHRAHHADLAVEAGSLTSLMDAYGIDRREHFRAFRIYLALLEEFSRLWYSDPQERLAFLNAEYDHWGNVAELRLHGYDRLANRMESGSGLP